jgi:hypothetical protein
VPRPGVRGGPPARPGDAGIGPLGARSRSSPGMAQGHLGLGTYWYGIWQWHRRRGPRAATRRTTRGRRRPSERLPCRRVRSLMLGDSNPPPPINGGTDHSGTGQRRKEETRPALAGARRIGTSCRSRDSERRRPHTPPTPHVGAQPTSTKLLQRDGAQSSSIAPNVLVAHRCTNAKAVPSRI